MRCNYLSLLNRYVDQELLPEQNSFVEAHIKSCPICSREIKYLLVMRDSISQGKIESNPDVFWQKLKSRLQDEAMPQEVPILENDLGNWARRLIPVPVAVGIIALLFLSVVTYKQNPIDEYLFGANFSDVSSLIEQPGNQSEVDALLF